MADSQTSTERQETPLMRQYHGLKRSYPDTLLLFRLGDFYETFEEDATIAAKVCGITLTQRNNGAADAIPLAGFPHHQLENYLPKLVGAGYRVAVCEQMEDPKQAKGIVKRDVVEVVTPGVSLNDQFLDASKNNYLCGLWLEGRAAGVAFCDISTGEFQSTEIEASRLDEVLEGIGPAEIILSRGQYDQVSRIKLSSSPRLTRLEEWIFDEEYGRSRLEEQFATHSLKGFGLENAPHSVIAAGAVMHYLMETQRGRLRHVRSIRRYQPEDYISLDPATKRNLEILTSGEGSNGALIDVLDETSTPMGGRLLRKWVVHPLKQLESISERLDSVEALYAEQSIASELAREMKSFCDLERVLARISTGRATPRDLANVRDTIDRFPRLVELGARVEARLVTASVSNLKLPDDLLQRLSEALPDDAPANLNDPNVIRRGYSPELDELRDLRSGAREGLDGIRDRERARTSIPSLKIGQNNVFGYYIEITNSHRDRVPEDYVRKQTLTNSERYITPELKEYEEKILNAEERIDLLQRELFQELQEFVADSAEELLRAAVLISVLDCLVSFAMVARKRGFQKPDIDDLDVLEIRAGRHPVVESLLPAGERFVSNDTSLSASERQLAIITGPNMAGKSVYLKQVGLIVLLAQIGSFVPAESARVGVVDKIFTRVGAQDNLAAGESTFLVEMHEAANILNNATNRSLILLDEVGRGTSTFDGISIAWAIAEYIHDRLGARTLFATHYHELNGLVDRFPRVRNLKVEVREHEDRIIFLRKVTPGAADHSYGIEVAKMAGLPHSVTERAREILLSLEGESSAVGGGAIPALRRSNPDIITPAASQISMFEIAAPQDPRLERVRKEIETADLDRMTPVEAMVALERFQRLLAEKENGEETPD